MVVAGAHWILSGGEMVGGEKAEEADEAIVEARSDGVAADFRRGETQSAGRLGELERKA